MCDSLPFFLLLILSHDFHCLSSLSLLAHPFRNSFTVNEKTNKIYQIKKIIIIMHPLL
ncbi:Uncharacterized protein APZ42_022900 [Daphnia magna]|uniref:Uncharacterized protein n=1 Tax=Daphnia magna TaxID=35525 RepID=A0A162C8A9_9CRUS|nr:Uncharacterized protein APZ42_022900 [Daphnia magna]